MPLTGKIIDSLVLHYAELSSGVEKADVIDEGWLSNNFAVQSGAKRYFLKCYRYAEKQRIVDAHAAKFFFASRGIPVILPLATKEEETILEIDNYYFSLFPFVSGVQFNKGTFPPLAIESLGAMLGRIHRTGEGGYPAVNKHFSPWDKKEFYKIADTVLGIINGKKDKNDFDLRVEEVIRFKQRRAAKEKIEYADFKNLREGLIHGDYHSGNVFFNEEGNVTHVFDFEKTCIAPFVFEIMRAIHYSSVTGYGREGLEGAVMRFLDGYRKERQVTDDELQDGMEIFYQKQIHDLWVEKEHYLNHNSRVDSLLHTIPYLERLDVLSKRTV